MSFGWIETNVKESIWGRGSSRRVQEEVRDHGSHRLKARAASQRSRNVCISRLVRNSKLLLKKPVSHLSLLAAAIDTK